MLIDIDAVILLTPNVFFSSNIANASLQDLTPNAVRLRYGIRLQADTRSARAALIDALRIAAYGLTCYSPTYSLISDKEGAFLTS